VLQVETVELLADLEEEHAQDHHADQHVERDAEFDDHRHAIGRARRGEEQAVFHGQETDDLRDRFGGDDLVRRQTGGAEAANRRLRCIAGEVADFAMTMMLAARRDLIQSQQFLLDDKWKGGWCPPSRSLVGAKVGIAGLGHIGQAIARRCEPFIPDIAWWGPRDKAGVRWPRRDSLVELAREVDILFVAVFAHPKMTRHLIDKEIIEALGADGLLVNVSRGFVVDELELIAALKDGRLGQAALDVFDPEPTDPKRWDGVPNVLLTPHIAGATRGSNVQLERHTIAKVCEFLGIKEDA